MAAPDGRTVVLALAGSLARRDLPAVDKLASALCERSGAEAVCDVSGAAPTAVAIDALARVGLAARRHACEARLQGASDELLDLLDLVGLRELFSA